MSKENVEKFLGLIRENKDLGVKLAQAPDSGEIEALARESGFEFTEAELREHLVSTGSDTIELSDGELAVATGGWDMQHFYVWCITCDKRLHDGMVDLSTANNIRQQHKTAFLGHWVETRNDLGI